jgi:capsular exopolysaccharide synthesis family protein
MTTPNRDAALSSFPPGAAGQSVMGGPEAPGPRSNPLLMIWRRWRVFVAVTLVCVVAAAVRYALADRVYRSEARLFVQTGGSKASGDGALLGNGSSHASLQTQCELIKSASILASVLALPDLMELRTFDQPSRWTTLKDNLTATVGRETDVITVTFDSPYPKEAQQVLRAVVDAYSGFHTKEKRSRVAELEKWRAKTLADLEKKQREVLEFKKANGALAFNGEKGNITLQKLASLQEAVTQAHIDSVNRRSALDAARAMATSPDRLRQLVDALRAQGLQSGDPGESTLRGQVHAMQQQLEQLNGRYGSAHPAVRSAESALVSMKARVGDMDRSLVQTHLLNLERQATAAGARERELQASYEEQRKLATALNEKAAEYEVMEAEVKRLAAAVEKADLQVVDLTATQNVGTPTIQVLDAPHLPARPIKPVANVALFQGLLVGLLLGCFAALVRDWTDQSLRSAEDVTETLGSPVLASVPHVPGPPNPLAQGRRVDLEPAGEVAEIYRTVRTAVFFGAPDRESRTILVTSPAPAEGKSTFASNLAIAIAQTGKRVLLLDADFRRPVQHRIFEARPGFGLSSVIAGHETLDKAIQNTPVPGLDLLPVGPIPSNPSEILNSPSFTEILEELSVRYEHVVIDSPPVLAVADARILAAQCSVTILVLRAKVSTRRAATEAGKALQSVGAYLLGVVMNDVPRARDPYGDYGGYGDDYPAEYAPEPTNVDLPPTPAAKPPATVPARSFLDLRRK